jgi:ADP-heptose:LPS heptosyltransferase
LKILVIKFKYLGDVVVSTPMLRALRQRFPQAELHVLIPEEAVPLLKYVPWLDKVWGFPRQRGRMQLKKTMPLLAELRAEKFDLSLDFVGNDRGAWTSFMIGAKERWGLEAPRGFLGRSWCYHHTTEQPDYDLYYEGVRELMILDAMGMGTGSRDTRLEIYTNPDLKAKAAELLPEGTILCHISSVQLKKEWPLEYWREFSIKAASRGLRLMFSAGISEREQFSLRALANPDLGIACLPPVYDLELFLAILQRAKLFVSADTGPLHFAVGLQTPTLSLFAPSDYLRWAPVGEPHTTIRGKECECSKKSHVCYNQSPCMASIKPEQVMEAVERAIFAKKMQEVVV